MLLPSPPRRFDGYRWMALLVAVLLCCAGCSRKDDSRVKLLIWHTKDAGEAALFRECIDEYNKQHPDRFVQALKKDPEELRNLYVIASVAGQGPDLIFGPSDTVGVLVTTKTILPLDELYPPGAQQSPNLFFSQFVEEGVVRWKDRPWMIGDQVGNHLVLVCNRELVPEPPKTLAELKDLAVKLTQRDERGNVTRFGLTWNYQGPFFFVPFLTGFGGWMMDANNQPSLDTPQTVAALAYVRALRESGALPKEGDYQTSSSLFKEGKAAMIINGSWSWSDYNVPEKAYIALLPLNESTGKRCGSTFSPNGYAVNVNVKAEKQPHVRHLLEYLTSPEIQVRMAMKLKTLPSSVAARQAPEVVNDETLRVSAEQIKHSYPMPVIPQMRQIWDGMTGPYQLMMNGRLTPEEGARLMQKECEKLYRDSQL